MKKIFLIVLMLSGLSIYADSKPNSPRLSKKDKQDLVEMFSEFIEGMERNSEIPVKEQVEKRWWFWQNPMTRIERSIDELNQIVQNIQNYIVDLTINNPHHGHHGNPHEIKECCKEALARLEHLELLLAKLIALLIEEREVIGSLDDQSVGEQEFNSVSDIDNAELSLVSWLKTIYREQLADKFIS